ncbi:MAG: NAD+ synthase [Chloroflexi bacterium]|nr:NAD+ synthase [Chloroflexota bacterium]MCL5109470.1 NAD+ synthase [Chloroflexota bacterium]
MKTRSLRIALAQINPTVGDLAGNTAKIADYLERARAAGADLVAFPELAVTGYPPEDLLLKPQFVRDNLAQLRRLAATCHGITAVVGFVDLADDLYNAAAILHDGEIVGVYHKEYLPNYGVFDEERYFRRGGESPIFSLRGTTFGVSVCEDIWYPVGPPTRQAMAGAEVLVNINASPYHAGKRLFREKMLATRAADNSAIVCYVNTVGGQDELVFDGASAVFDQQGQIVARAVEFAEELLVADVDAEAVFRARLHDPRRRQAIAAEPTASQSAVLADVAARERPPLEARLAAPLEAPAEVYQALVLGTRDYVHKNGFQKVLIGLSGGIDSSLVAAIAADALGPEQVMGVSMPSRYSSAGSKDDAVALADNLGMAIKTVPIEEMFGAALHTLAPSFQGTEPGLAEENLQARLRGNIMMALSNKFGHLVLTTGNKSEMATGYATLYGDMAGGFAVIKDVLKGEVYELCRYRNTLGEKPVIPPAVLEKPPSAELRPDQKDSDSLPPYPILDPILHAYVEEDRSAEEIVALGCPEETVRRVIALVDRSEYKRRQAPPGVKISPRAFGRDRRLPITNRYRG